MSILREENEHFLITIYSRDDDKEIKEIVKFLEENNYFYRIINDEEVFKKLYIEYTPVINLGNKIVTTKNDLEEWQNRKIEKERKNNVQIYE